MAAVISPKRPRWRELDKRVWQMAFARSINTMGLSLVMSFLGVYIVETRGYPAWLYGVIALAANLGQSLSSAWAGNLSDRIGRRPLITTALFVRSLFIAALGTQIAFHAPIWSLAINMMITSALRGCFEPVAYALVADVVTNEQRVSAFGLQRMGTNFGWAIGPAVGGMLTLVVPYGYVFYFAAIGMVIAGFVTMGVKDPIARQAVAQSDDLRSALHEAIVDVPFRLLLAGTFLSALMSTQMFSTLAIYMTDEIKMTKADVGLLYMLNGIGVLVLQVPALAIIRRFGILATLPASSLVFAISFALVGAATGWTGAAAAMVAITAAEVVFSPAHQAAIAEIADPTRRGRAYGVVAFVQMVGIALAPLAGGALFDTIGRHHGAMWITIGVIGLAATSCFSAFVKRRGIESRR